MTVQSEVQPFSFHDDDVEYLMKRAVDPQFAYDEGLRSIDEAEAHRLTGNVTHGGGLCQAYRAPLPKPWGPGVDRQPYYRIQLRERDANGGRKTDTPSGSPVPLWFTNAAASPSTEPIFISESPIKALSIASNGYAHSVGLGGVTAGFFDVGGSKGLKMQKHLDPFFPKGRPVYVVLDSNRLDNAMVAISEARIGRKLLDRGCLVKVVEVPKAEDGEDQGPDDFIAAHGGPAFDELVQRARDADPMAHAEAVKDDPERARGLLADAPFSASLSLIGPAGRKAVAKVLSAYFSPKDVEQAWNVHPASQTQRANSMSSAGPALGPWSKSLLTDKKGVILSVTSNYSIIVENDPRWMGVVAFNEISNDIVFMRQPPQPQFLTRRVGEAWVDEDDVSLANWLQVEHGIHGAKVNAMRQVIALAARRKSFCPLRDWLGGLAWDGVDRVDDWLAEYCIAPSTAYTRLVGKMWLVSAVARAFQPGAQVDSALVFEGAQGAGKSSAFRILGGAFFTDDLRSLGDAEAAKQLRGKWICELSELAAVTRKELDTIKSFITRRVDNYRPSYGRTSLDFERRAVFCGSINPVAGSGYLKDPTGERRWWPVAVGEIRLDDLARDRDQLWAEAVALFKSGTRWHPTRDEQRLLFEPEQSSRREVDAFEEPLRKWLSKAVGEGRFVRMPAILTDALQIPLERHGSYINRVRKIMHTLGWESRNAREGVEQFKAWFRGPYAEGYDPRKDTPEDVVGDVFGAILN